jgi:hypothetical protein
MRYDGINCIGEFKLERVATLPVWSSTYEGRMVYAEDTKRVYIGINSAWRLLTKTTDDVDLTATAAEINFACDQSVDAFHTTGRKVYIYENTAPTGWTTESVTDRVIAIKGGSQAYDTSGGTQVGSWTQPSHTLITSEIPAHNHGGSTGSTAVHGHSSGGWGAHAEQQGPHDGTTSPSHNHSISSQGGGGSHNHGTTYRPYAAIGIIVSKD